MMEIENKIDQMLEMNNFNHNTKDDICNDIARLFEHSSKESFGTVKKKLVNHKQRSTQDWFDPTCRHMRNVYNKSRRLYNKYKNTYFKSLLKDVSKQYKNTLRIARNKFNNDKIEKLRNLR